MAFSAEISRTNPTAFVFLLDQSDSMREPFGAQPEKTKAGGVADAINRLLQNVILKCTKADGVRDFFHVSILRYGGDVSGAFGGALAGEVMVPVGKLADNPLRIESRTRLIDDGAGGLIEQKFKFPVWFEGKPAGRTPMCAALGKAAAILREFLARYPACYPPLVINITDGKPTDGDPRPIAQEVASLQSSDGNVLLFNAHLSDKAQRPIEFPDDEKGLPDDFARLLYRMSSNLPAKLAEAALHEGYIVGQQSRGFVFNADLVSVIRFLDIGTRAARGMRLT